MLQMWSNIVGQKQSECRHGGSHDQSNNFTREHLHLSSNENSEQSFHSSVL